MIEQLPEIEIVLPEYPNNFTKHNTRQRKKMNILQYSEAIIQLILPVKHTEDVITWWEGEYQAKGEEFLVEVFTGGFDNQGNPCPVEINFLSETPFYKVKDGKIPSVQDEPDMFAIKAISMIPPNLQDKVVKVNISDWDYTPVEDNEYDIEEV